MSRIKMIEELPKSGRIPKGLHYFDKIFHVFNKAYKFVWFIDENNLNYIGAVNNYRKSENDEK